LHGPDGDAKSPVQAGFEKGSLVRSVVNDMRAETQNLVEEIKQSVRLLRRHL
jgi:hypothetical protein